MEGALEGGCAGVPGSKTQTPHRLGDLSPFPAATQLLRGGAGVLLASGPGTAIKPSGRLCRCAFLPSLNSRPPSKHLEASTACPVEAGHGPGDGRWETTFSTGMNTKWSPQVPHGLLLQEGHLASLTPSVPPPRRLR